MFSFEGDFKTRPKVSLGGASRKEEKASLLHRTQEERRKREEERRRQRNAVIIQSFLRGYRDRKQQHMVQRSEFDDYVSLAQLGGNFSISDGHNLTVLIRKLLFFYKQNEDLDRLTWICQNLVKHSAQYVQQLADSNKHICLYQIKRLLGLCCSQTSTTFMPHEYRFLKLECMYLCRHQVFAALAKEFFTAPFTDQIYNFLIPALSARASFPYVSFLSALLIPNMTSSVGLTFTKDMAPWLLYFVLAVGESQIGVLSEDGMLVYLRMVQILLPQLPVSLTGSNSREIGSDSENEEEEERKMITSNDDGRISISLITAECLKKLDTKQQTNALLNLVWKESVSEDVFTMMASICHTLMVQHRMMVPKIRLLYSLAFNARFMRHLWNLITSVTTKMITGSMVSLLQLISRGSPMSLEDSHRIIPLFYLFSSLFSHSLISVHDNEFFGEQTEGGVGQQPPTMMPFTLSELVTLSRCLRDACLGIIHLAYPETKPEVREEYMVAFKSIGVRTNTEMQQRIEAERKRWIQLFKVISNLVKMLKSRDTRRQFCPPDHWLSDQVNIRADKVTQLYVPSARHVWRMRRMGRIGPLQSTLDVGQEPAQLSVSEERHLAILTELPFVVPFEERVKIFQRLIFADKQDVQGEGPFLDGINVTIRRNYIYEDAYDKLSPENASVVFWSLWLVFEIYAILRGHDSVDTGRVLLTAG
ncbi:ubiquitin-protein ligase E3C [Rhincodon typus]|uniref:ubiquitin-protein ligase E3C n=1 Tax=Rhincodon typus TaxID=259920 RepID=UPI00202F7293|nr:ubiquitin-protein ligase E3C [Rhincodon typus]